MSYRNKPYISELIEKPEKANDTNIIRNIDKTILELIFIVFII